MRKLILNETFGIIVLAIILIPQIAHTVYVFEANSHVRGAWYHWCYAVGIDLAILIFTVKGWPRTAFAFFIGTLAHNIAYQFAPAGVGSALLTSAMLSATILAFSHLFFQTSADPAGSVDLAGSADLAGPADPGSKHAQLLAALDAGLRFEAQPYECPACGTAFASAKQLNGHVSAHKQQGQWQEENYGPWEEANTHRAGLRPF